MRIPLPRHLLRWACIAGVALAVGLLAIRWSGSRDQIRRVKLVASVETASRCSLQAAPATAQSCHTCHPRVAGQWQIWASHPRPARAVWPPGQVQWESADAKSCTDCHVPSVHHQALALELAAPRQPAMLRSALLIRIEPSEEVSAGTLSVTLTNLTGHAYPTGSGHRAIQLIAQFDPPDGATFTAATLADTPAAEAGISAPLQPGESRRIFLTVPPGTTRIRCAAVYLHNRSDPSVNPVEMAAAESIVSGNPPLAEAKNEWDSLVQGLPGLNNLHWLSSGLLCGATPDAEVGFDTLAAMQVRTVLSVDGRKPDLDAASSRGIRYVHLPVGYDGIPRDVAMQIVQVVRELEGPIYIHCYHGVQRGPAAAAIAAIATEGWTHEQAAAWLSHVGTSPSFFRLYESVQQFDPPSADELAAAGDPRNFPEAVDPPLMRHAMIGIDRLYEALRSTGKVDPADAALLHQELQELLDIPETVERGEDFVNRMRRTASQAADLARTLDPQHLARLQFSCRSCHATHRD